MLQYILGDLFGWNVPTQKMEESDVILREKPEVRCGLNRVNRLGFSFGNVRVFH